MNTLAVPGQRAPSPRPTAARAIRPWQSPAALLLALCVSLLLTPGAWAQGRKWVSSWTTSPQGPYPNGFSVAQPDLSFALPNGATEGAVDQTFRLIVKPDLWSNKLRLRFSNNLGTQPLTLNRVRVGIQAVGGNLLPGTNRPVAFNGGQASVTIPVGQEVYSDAFKLPTFVGDPVTASRNLAVSIHAAGPTGPMTYHVASFFTSYLSAPGSGDHTEDATEDAFPYSTTSWFFLDAVEVRAPLDAFVVCAFGDSITDGFFSTLNEADRWPDVLSRRLHAVYGNRVAVVTEAIGGNSVTRSPRADGLTINGGPFALDRLDRDVLGLQGLASVIWLEGINDLGVTPATVGDVVAGFQEGVGRLRARGVKVIGATVVSALRTPFADYGTAATDAKRRALNDFIRTPGSFDDVADMDAATIDSATGTLRAPFLPNSTTGVATDFLHPNRAGFQAMGNSVPLEALAPAP